MVSRTATLWTAYRWVVCLLCGDKFEWLGPVQVSLVGCFSLNGNGIALATQLCVLNHKPLVTVG